MAKKTYQVQNPIKYNGKEFAVGDQLDLDDEDAVGLLEVKAIEPSTAPSNAPVVPADEAGRIATIVAAITQLDPGNAEQWLKDGRPKSDALAVYTGFPLSAAERDAAWELHNSEL